jgi:hypothetical protein
MKRISPIPVALIFGVRTTTHYSMRFAVVYEGSCMSREADRRQKTFGSRGSVLFEGLDSLA